MITLIMIMMISEWIVVGMEMMIDNDDDGNDCDDEI